MNEGENEKSIREMNEVAERDAKLSGIKAQLWRRIAAAMAEISRAPVHEPLRQSPPSLRPRERAE